MAMRILFAVIEIILVGANMAEGIKTCDYDKEKKTISIKPLCHFVGAIMCAIAFGVTLAKIIP